MDRGLPRLKSWFADYVGGFYTADPELRRVARMKERHTARVCMVVRRLGGTLNLQPRELVLAESMALLHDVGRFPQYATYRTFRDPDSENHALLGLRVIGRHRLLSGFNPAERRHIARAVAFHNAAHLPDLPDPQSLGYLKLLRDADKLDILKVMIGHYGKRRLKGQVVDEFGVSAAAGCSGSVMDALRAGRVVPFADTRSVDDVRLLYISWVFDLNFKASFREVRRGGYLARLAAPLPETRKVQEVVQRAHAHVARNAA
jgi:hypothetical protein